MTEKAQVEDREEIENILEEKSILQEKLKTIEQTRLAASVSERKTQRPPEPDSVEIKKRQEYLRMQRDKLVALKKEARKKQLDTEASGAEKPQVRPKSARAAEKILEGDAGGIDPQQLQIRKSLAERLRNKVVKSEK